MTRHLAWIAMLILLAGCKGDSTTPADVDPLSRASVISASTPEFASPVGARVRWYSPLVWTGELNADSQQNAEMLQAALQAEFERRGYAFVVDGADADYDVLGVAVLGELGAHPEIEEIFRLYPSLAPTAADYTSGTVLVAIAPAGTNRIVWRGALEVFTGVKLPADLRRERMQAASMMLLGSVPSP